ncbi:MAG: hypothetical protein C0467_26660 [Planctomycetaceae bacterium]|nr:hypothetical protein [Planctomycetaceae bacterium]
MDYTDWGRLLSERFPTEGKTEAELERTESEWSSLKERLTTGQSVTGVVIAKAHFGAWIDIGVGFPALLEIVCIAGLTPEHYRADDWCPIGSEVTAFVGGFSDRGHQIGLWQVRPGEQRRRG